MKKQSSWKTKLKALLDSIDKQFITLNKVEFSKSSQITEAYPKEIKAKHKLEIGISTGKAKNENHEMPLITITYRHSEELYIEGEEEAILTVKIEYNLNILLKETKKSVEILNNKEVIEKYAEGTGLLTVYPYIRHMADILHREARIYIPPYPPVKVKQPR